MNNQREVMDIIFFDLETQHTFQELGMFNSKDKDPSKLKHAISGVLYEKNNIEEHKFFGEGQVNQLMETLSRADLIVGHNLFRFDYQVLQQYFKYNVTKFLYDKTFDTLLELQKYTNGCWTSLDDLAKRNLGTHKMFNGAKIPELWRNNQFKEVEEYLLNDLRMTRDFYNYAKTHKKIKYMHKEYGKEIGEREVNVIW